MNGATARVEEEAAMRRKPRIHNVLGQAVRRKRPSNLLSETDAKLAADGLNAFKSRCTCAGLA